MREYRRISGKELDETVKTGTLIEEAPPQLEEHPRLRFEETATNCKQVILSIEDCVRPEKSWASAGHADMDIGEVSEGRDQPKARASAKGKGKGDECKGQLKGKGQGKGRSHKSKHSELLRKDANKSDRKCFVCCRPGQFAKDCDHRVRTW